MIFLTSKIYANWKWNYFFFKTKMKCIYITSEIFSPHCVSWLPQLSISSRVFVTVVAVVLELLFFLWLSLSPLARHQDFSQCSKRLHMIFSRKKNVSYLKVKWFRTLDFGTNNLLALDFSAKYCIITTVFDNSLHQVWMLLLVRAVQRGVLKVMQPCIKTFQ